MQKLLGVIKRKIINSTIKYYYVKDTEHDKSFFGLKCFPFHAFFNSVKLAAISTPLCCVYSMNHQSTLAHMKVQVSPCVVCSIG